MPYDFLAQHTDQMTEAELKEYAVRLRLESNAMGSVAVGMVEADHLFVDGLNIQKVAAISRAAGDAYGDGYDPIDRGYIVPVNAAERRYDKIAEDIRALFLDDRNTNPDHDRKHDQEIDWYNQLKNGGTLESVVAARKSEYELAQQTWDRINATFYSGDQDITSQILFVQIRALDNVRARFNLIKPAQESFNEINARLTESINIEEEVADPSDPSRTVRRKKQLFSTERIDRDKDRIVAEPWVDAATGAQRQLTYEKITEAKNIKDKIIELRGEYQEIINSPEYTAEGADEAGEKHRAAKKKLEIIEKRAIEFYEKFGGFQPPGDLDYAIVAWRPELDKKKELNLTMLHKELVGLSRDAHNLDTYDLIIDLFTNHGGDVAALGTAIDSPVYRGRSLTVDERTRLKKILEDNKDLIQKIKDHQEGSDPHLPIRGLQIEIRQESKKTRRQKQRDIADKVVYDLTHSQPRLNERGLPIANGDGLAYKQTHIGRIRTTFDDYKHNQATNGPQYLRAAGIKVLAMFGLANIDRLVRNETQGLTEYFADIQTRTEATNNHVYTDIRGVGGSVGELYTWTKTPRLSEPELDEHGDPVRHNLSRVDMLCDIDLIQQQREAEEAAKKKRKRGSTGRHQDEDYLQGINPEGRTQRRKWHAQRRPLDSYFRDKEDELGGIAIGSKTEFDDYQDGHLQAHQVLDYIQENSMHNPAMMALFSVMRNFDFSNGRTFDSLDTDSTKAEMKKLYKEMRKSVDITKMTKKYRGFIEDLDHQKKVHRGSVWEDIMKQYNPHDHDPEPYYQAVEGEILQLQRDLQEAIDRMTREAADAKEKWEKRTKELSSMFHEGEFRVQKRNAAGELILDDQNRPVDGPRQYYTFKAIKRSDVRPETNAGDLAVDRHEWSFSRNAESGYYEFSNNQLALNAIKNMSDNTIFIEVSLHTFNDDGTHVDGEHEIVGHDRSKGRVIGYIDSRTGSLVGARGTEHIGPEPDEERFFEEALDDDEDDEEAFEEAVAE